MLCTSAQSTFVGEMSIEAIVGLLLGGLIGGEGGGPFWAAGIAVVAVAGGVEVSRCSVPGP
jgi:hypothetical protein